MGFAEAKARLQKAIFGSGSRGLGEDALWNDQTDPVRVRFREEDEIGRFGGGSELILRARVLKVRRSEVLQPVTGDEVRLVASGRRFQITSDPVLDVNANWECPVEEVTV